MRKPRFLWILLVPLLLAACQGGTAAPTENPTLTSQPVEPTSAPTATGPSGEDSPMMTPTSAPGGSDSGLWSAYPPADTDASLQKGNVFLDESGLIAVNGQPGVAVLTVTGNLPTPCHQIRAQVSPPDANNVVAVEVYSVTDPNMICTQVLKPFSMEIARIAGLPSGSYSVTVNGAEVGKLDVPVEESTATATSPTPAPSPVDDAQMILSQTVNGLEMVVRNIRRGDGQLKADICHPLPDADSWFLGHLVLRYGDHEVREWVGSTEQPDTPAGNGTMGRRCMTAAFKVPSEEGLAEFQIIVETLESPPRADQVCARLDAGKQKLADAGLVVECREDGGYSVNSANSTVSEEEAMRILHDLEFRTIHGPWEFAVKMQ